MLLRIAYGSLAVATLLAVVSADVLVADYADGMPAVGDLLQHGSFIPVLFTAVMVVGVWELVRLLRSMGYQPHVACVASGCVLMMLSPWLCAGGVLGDSPLDLEALAWQLVWLMVTVFAAAGLQFSKGPSKEAFADIGVNCLIVLYLGFLPSFAIQIRADVNLADSADGAWFLLVILAVVFASDIGALAVGMMLGRRKLAPKISPGKTVAGFFGGMGGSLAVALALKWVSTRSAGGDFEPVTALERLSDVAREIAGLFNRLDLAQTIILAVVTSVVSQMGDLFESLVKRSAQVKHSSGLIPEMGGVLDVVDGALFAMPAVWFLLTMVWDVV